MANIFNLPDVGEGMAEGEIASWLVKVGDVVAEGDSILELQNDKLLQEIPSPFSGTVTSIFVEAGTVSRVGDPLIEFDGDGSTTPPTTAAAAPVEEAPAAPAPVAPVAPVVEPNKETVIDPLYQAIESMQTTANAPVLSPTGHVLAMPSVRRLAHVNNIDIATVAPSGKHGHVTREDVEAVINGGGTILATATTEADVTTNVDMTPIAPLVGLPVGEAETREPMTGMRKAIANAMVTSKATAPHVTLFDEVDVTKLVAHRNKFKVIAAEQDVKLTFLPYMVKALVAVVKKYPILNTSMDNATQEIVHKNYYNIGIATDTERGLFVPVIKNADSKGMLTIASDITALSSAAQEGKLQGPDMTGGSITITNIGSVGGAWFTPVINYPEVAILGVGRINKQPIVNAEGELAVGEMLKLSLSFDHRLIDGATAQKAMNELKQLLSDPDFLLMS